MRRVGTESSKSYKRRNTYFTHCFFDDYLTGNGLDIGFAGYTPDITPITSTSIGVDVDFPGYDGKTLPFPDESQDYVYSSHTLEHISDYVNAIRDWYRVTKTGGHIITVVPHQFLYEKKLNKPSKWNEDHKRFYTPAKLLAEFEKALEPNSYRVRFLEDGDVGFNYKLGPDQHSSGEYEITLVIEKIENPTWSLE